MLKKTKIICTQGPATDPEGIVDALIENGMNCARFNFSHGTHEEHLVRINKVRAAAERSGKVISLILDTKGPEMRLGEFADGKVQLEKGQQFTLTYEDTPGDATHVSVNHKNLYNEVKAGDTLYSIAKRSEITVDELRRLNSLDSSAVLKIGQNLKVPAQSTAAAQSGSAVQNAGSSSSGLALSVPDTSSSARDNLSLIGSDKDPRAYSKKNGDTSLVWPVKASEVVYVAGKISGVALTGAKNEHVTAIRSGTVMFSGIYRGFGQVVFVQSANGLIYVYTGLDTLAVTKGQKVNYGQQLGIIGSDPISGKNLINLMVFKNGSPMDPAKAPRG